jgi:hypothetical protein
MHKLLFQGCLRREQFKLTHVILKERASSGKGPRYKQTIS